MQEERFILAVSTRLYLSYIGYLYYKLFYSIFTKLYNNGE